MSINARPTILFATATALALRTCGATSSPLHARRKRRFLVRGRVDRRFLYPPQRSDPCSDGVALVLQEGRPALADDGVRQVPAHRGVDEGEPAEPRRHSRDRQDPATEPEGTRMALLAPFKKLEDDISYQLYSAPVGGGEATQLTKVTGIAGGKHVILAWSV